MNHALQHVPHFVRRKERFVCARDVLHYGQFQAAAVKHFKIHAIYSVYILLLYVLQANLNSQRHNNLRLITIE